MSHEDPFYRLAPGVDIVPLGGGDVLLRSNSVSVRLEGGSSTFFADDVLPLLDGRRSLTELTTVLGGVSPDDLRLHLDHLVSQGVLHRGERAWEPENDPRAPILAMLEDLGVAPPEARERLRTLSVAVVGLEGHGAHLAWNLAVMGIGKLILLDPYPCEPGNLSLMPGLDQDAVGKPRHDVVRAALDAGATAVLTCGKDALTREDIDAIAGEVHIMVGCFDRAFSATNVWINGATLDHGIAALYAELRGHSALLGPLVLPGQTPCYMCWRMRALACEDNFEEAMTYEEVMDRRKRPALHERSTLPFLTAYAGSVVGSQVLTSMLEVSIPALAGKVLEFNGLTLKGELHTVLQEPGCPACAKRNPADAPPPLDRLASRQQPPGAIQAAESSLISRRCGVVRDFRKVPRDPSEPLTPYVYRAQLANHRFAAGTGDELVASGKGMTDAQARASALGEAVERYSSACWNDGDAIFATRAELADESLDPRELVLYRPEQYSDVPYAPYEDTSSLGWVWARSLVTDRPVLVPALAVNMAYQVRSQQEYLFGPTSNGLAAGPTLADAILAAALEVMERDAFMIAWSNRLPCDVVDPLTHPDGGVRNLARSYRRREVALHLARLPVDHPVTVMLAIALEEGDREPAAVIGLGADLNPARAAGKAVLEIGQVRPALRMRLRDPKTRARLEELVADPHRVSGLDDHDLLYASQSMARAFDFLPLHHGSDSWEPIGGVEQPPATALGGLDRLIGHFRSVGQDLLYCDLSPPDMAALGLRTVRVIIPRFQPIDFGWKERRLGGTRLFELPYRLGLAPSPTTVDMLNDLPHPLA